MMKWRLAVEDVYNSDGTCDRVHLFDQVLHATAGETDKNAQRDRLLEHTPGFIDEVFTANCYILL